jgi:hypothetical protein
VHPTLTAWSTAIAALFAASAAPAQQWPSLPEVRPFVGAYVPAGRQHQLLTNAVALGAQVAMEFGHGTHAVASFTWIPTEQRGVATSNRIEMAQFDLGAEWLSPGRRRLQERFNPLLGAGLGVRAYRSRDVDTPSQANLAAYGSLGGELALGRFGVRLEGRDYLTLFRGLGGQDATSLRSDAAVALGVAYHFKR